MAFDAQPDYHHLDACTDGDEHNPERSGNCGMTVSLPADVENLSWAAGRLGIGVSTAYRLASLGQIPGAFKVGGQWRVSVVRFEREVHGA